MDNSIQPEGGKDENSESYEVVRSATKIAQQIVLIDPSSSDSSQSPTISILSGTNCFKDESTQEIGEVMIASNVSASGILKGSDTHTDENSTAANTRTSKQTTCRALKGGF